MGIIQTITGAIANFFRWIGRNLKKIWARIIDFFSHVVDYFRRLRLNPQEDTPFVFDAGKMGEMIKNAPKVDVGIFEGVYNEETNRITHHRLIETEELDERTSNLLDQSENGLVTLC